MTDYKKPCEALRVEPFEVGSVGVARVMQDAAAAIEVLQAEVKILKVSGREAYFEGLAADDNGRQVKEPAKRNAELHAELEKWVSAAEKAGEPKRGKWELIDGAEPMRWGCSRCKYLSWETSNYCPRCGAKVEVQE